MRGGAFEIETVTGLELVVLVVADPDFKCAANHVEKFLAFVRVRFAAAAARLDAEEMGLHDFVAPGEQFHANALCGFKDAAFLRRNETGIFLRRVEKRKKVSAVVPRDARERGDGSAHLAAFERTEKTDGDAGGAGDLHKRKIAALAETAKTLAGRKNTFGGNGDNALTLEDVNDGGRV